MKSETNRRKRKRKKIRVDLADIRSEGGLTWTVYGAKLLLLYLFIRLFLGWGDLHPSWPT
jgi:hypothetical protein